MKTDIVFENLVVGQELYSTIFGECKLLRIREDDYAIVVKLENGAEESFTKECIYVSKHNLPTLFLTNPFEKNQERVIEVKCGNQWIKRVLIKVVDGEAICWNNSKSIEESEISKGASNWSTWRELQPEQPTAQPKEIKLDGVEYILTPKVK